jgi:predicted phage tail protein
MLRKIKLYGQLAKFIGRRVLEADVATAAEAVRMLVANFPGLEQHMAEQYYRVTVGTYDLGLDEIHDPAGQQDIKIVPVVAGAGGAAENSYWHCVDCLSFAIPGGLLVLWYLRANWFGVGNAIWYLGNIGTIGVSLALRRRCTITITSPQSSAGSRHRQRPTQNI